MADTNLETAWTQVIENRTNRKLVFQTLLSIFKVWYASYFNIFKQALEKKSDDVINKTISHQDIQKVLQETYYLRFGVLVSPVSAQLRVIVQWNILIFIPNLQDRLEIRKWASEIPYTEPRALLGRIILLQ